ncbi:hypothetical protein MUK42_03614 [Musa troglodytarum]|uniref:Uncharacterized protein n=1 Tax=Musa troglodytarum TaxID=320322 RepID=A0A9E7KWC3_9LILI|nr:hypothetical protein MUK42_03614 [Musa troglodytarum]
MPNPPHTAAWVAEFALRQPVEDWLANEIFLALPLPSFFFFSASWIESSITMGGRKESLSATGDWNR